MNKIIYITKALAIGGAIYLFSVYALMGELEAYLACCFSAFVGTALKDII